MKKIILCTLITCTAHLSAEIKRAEDLFTSWITEQSYYQRCLGDTTNNDRVDKNSLLLPETASPFKTQLLSIAGDKKGNLNPRKIQSLRNLASHAMPQFLSRLRNAGIAGSTVNTLDAATGYHEVIDRYVGVFNTVFNDQTAQSPTREFAIANRFFEFCFSPNTFSRFQSIMEQEETKPLGRFLYANLWQKLVSTGWIYWHKDTLTRLKKSADKGKTIVYVAGGSDIYQLIANGIYNLRIIDPYLEGSQDKYYANSWQFLLRGNGDHYGQGDELQFSFPNKNVTMKRALVTPGQFFDTDLETGVQVHLPADIVAWNVFENDIPKGKITIERRQAETKDFQLKKNEELLMSFNELYFVALPDHLQGWGIGAHQLPDDIKIHVKQLRKPLTKKIVENLVWADEQKLSFMKLGSSAR